MENRTIGHSAAITDLGMCINHYRLHTVGLYVCIGAGVKLRDQLIHPDLIVMINAGDRKQCEPDYINNYFAGPPNFVLDIYNDPKSSASKDRKYLLQNSGVEEYLIVSEDLSRIEWNRLEKGTYKTAKPDKEGIIRSTSLPGLWIPIPAMKNRDWWTVMACIDHGVTRKEHHDLMDSIWNKK